MRYQRRLEKMARILRSRVASGELTINEAREIARQLDESSIDPNRDFDIMLLIILCASGLLTTLATLLTLLITKG